MSDGIARNGVPAAVARPREPTPADNRRVLDALYAHFDVDRGFYQQSWSDKALAAHLDVPASWVTGCRERFFGGVDRNDASSLAAIAQLEARLAKLLSDAAAIETDVNKLKERLR